MFYYWSKLLLLLILSDLHHIRYLTLALNIEMSLNSDDT